VTEENKREIDEISSLPKAISSNVGSNYHGSFFQQIPDSKLCRFDERLCRVNMIEAHLLFLQKKLDSKSINFKFFNHFCMHTFRIIGLNTNYEAAFSIKIMSYLEPKDLATILGTSKEMRSTLQDLRDDHISALSKIRKP
jgi:hypothetical protein